MLSCVDKINEETFPGMRNSTGGERDYENSREEFFPDLKLYYETFIPYGLKVD
jgi:hypothetical protein